MTGSIFAPPGWDGSPLQGTLVPAVFLDFSPHEGNCRVTPSITFVGAVNIYTPDRREAL